MNYVSPKIIKQECQISYMTLKRWKDEGKIQYKKLSNKKILYDIDSILKKSSEQNNRKNVIYARVSTTSQKSNLDHQIELIKSYMLSNGIKVDEIYSEIASGLNEDRQELNRLIQNIKENKISNIYVSFKDRLTRFGFNYFKNIFAMYNTNIIVLDEQEETNKDFQQELVEDLIFIVHHYSTKLYSNRRKKMKEIENLLSDKNFQENLDK